VDKSTKEVIVTSLNDGGCDLAFDLGLIRYELVANCLCRQLLFDSRFIVS
jgi:hypothetical protein